jgi:DUF1707 SHOCT-like domain
MTTDTDIRASDDDRERTVAILREAFVAGRLTLAEFSERTSAAFTSRTWGELRALTRDLPAGPVLGPDPPAAPARPAAPQAGLLGEAPPERARWPGGPGAARLIPALPIAVVWLAISLLARSPAAFIPLAVLLLVGLRVAAGRPCDSPVRRPSPPARRHPPHQRYPHWPPGPR